MSEGVTFSQAAAKRIVAAVKELERWRTSISRPLRRQQTAGMSTQRRGCKITTDNNDGTYDVEEWDRVGDAGTGWTQEGIEIWESKGDNFWEGEGADVYVTIDKFLGTWYITIGYAILETP